MTVAQARMLLDSIGVSIRRTPYGEYRVNYKGGTEATAYYATDLKDAVETGIVMARQRRNPRLRKHEGYGGKRKHHELHRYWARMYFSLYKEINRQVMGSSAYDAAQRISHAHLGNAQVFPGRHEGSMEGYPIYSYAVEGYGSRLWIRRAV